MKKGFIILSFFGLCFMFKACTDDSSQVNQPALTPALGDFDYFEDDIPYSTLQIGNRNNHDKEAALGRILYYDTRLSYNDALSCGSCHQQAKAFCDNEQFSQGLYSKSTDRNSISLANVAYHPSSFWNGMSGSLSNHILQPVSNHIEMGMRSSEELVERLNKIDAYQELFEEVYGNEATVSNVTNSLASFVSSLISYDSKYDKGKEIEFANFSLSEKRGMELFFGKAKCQSCHRDGHFTAQWRRSTNIGLDLEYADQGAGNGRFKVPTLRNVELSAPYMHDGRFASLEEVVEHYSTGIRDHEFLDWELRGGPLDLEEEEKEDLVSFLKTLTDYTMLNDPKFSNPFH